MFPFVAMKSLLGKCLMRHEGVELVQNEKLCKKSLTLNAKMSFEQIINHKYWVFAHISSFIFHLESAC